MTARVGVLRSAAGLADAAGLLDGLAGAARPTSVDQESWETTNLLTIAAALDRRRRAARGDPRVALARGLPRARRRPLGRPLRRGHRRRRHHPALPAGAGQRRSPRVSPDPRVVRTAYADLSRDLVAELAGAGLDPLAVYEHVVLAFEEDLPDGGVDVTSAAMPPMGRAVADVVAREDGVVAGLAVAELAFRYALGEHVRVTDRVPDGTRVRPGRRRDHGRGTGPGRAHRRADRAELRLPPVRGRHRHRGLGRRRWRAPGRGCSTPARRCPAGARCRSTPCAAAAGSTTASASRDRAMVKDNHVVAAGGVVPAYRRRAGRPARTCASRWRSPTSTSCVELLDAGCEEILLDNMSTRHDGRGGRASSGTGPPAG